MTDYWKFFPYLVVIYFEYSFAKILERKKKFCITLGTDLEGFPFLCNDGSLYHIYSAIMPYVKRNHKIKYKSIEKGIILFRT